MVESRPASMTTNFRITEVDVRRVSTTLPTLRALGRSRELPSPRLAAFFDLRAASKVFEHFRFCAPHAWQVPVPFSLITQGIPLAWHRSQGSYGPRLASNSRSPKHAVPPPAWPAARSHYLIATSSCGGAALPQGDLPATSRVILAWTSSHIPRYRIRQQVVTNSAWSVTYGLVSVHTPQHNGSHSPLPHGLVRTTAPTPSANCPPWPSILQILFTDPAYQSTQVRVGFPHHRCLR